MRRTIAAAAISLLGSANIAGAENAGHHTISWYAAHPAARASLLRLCRNDYAYARRSDCLNAEQAEVRQSAKDLDSKAKWGEKNCAMQPVWLKAQVGC